MEICGKLLWKTSGPAAEGTRSGPAQEGCPEMPSALGHVGACSACTGDYEDPDRTAWPTDGKHGGADEEKRSSGEGEFAVQET